jgi:hypothetical protein
MAVRHKAATIEDVIANAQSFSATGPSTVGVTSAQLADKPEDRLETIAIEDSRA